MRTPGRKETFTALRRLSLVALLALTPSVVGSTAAHAVTIVGEASTFEVTYLDGASEGFNSLAGPLGGQTGNTGATLGEQRRIAFEYAAKIFADLVVSSVPIEIDIAFDPLSPCSASSGVLGFAGFNTSHEGWTEGTPPPLANTWYPQALANSYAGEDLHAGSRDITARFNSSVGSGGCLSSAAWYYGLDENPPPSNFDFVTVALHEVAHGLGFATLVSLSSGTKAVGLDDTYMVNLEDHSLASTWPSMSDAERQASAKDTGDLHWIGPEVIAAGASLSAGKDGSGHVRMYAPSSLQSGSSVSHFDTSLVPNDLMEPFLSDATHDVTLTSGLFLDIGWVLRRCGNGVVEAPEECDDGNSDPFDGCTNECTFCGNNIVTPPEQCDDGDLVNNDGCDSNCTFPACGNEVVNPGLGEECDDGNAIDTDACRNDCTLNICGDGSVYAGVEECDDGNMIDGDGCDSNCTFTACMNGVQTAGEECDDGNTDPSDGCTNWCTACGNNVVTPPEQCDDGDLVDGDGCEARCIFTGQLPPVDYTPAAVGKKDYASVACLKAAGVESIRFASQTYNLVRKCLDAIVEREARIAAGLSPSSVASASAAAARKCVEPSATAADGKTMLGKIASAETKATSVIERKCGLPDATTVDNRTIGSKASNDFTTPEIQNHLRRIRCEVEDLIGRGYATAAADLATLDARPSQGGLGLDQSFPCIDQAELSPVGLSAPPGKKDSSSVRCQSTVGAQIGKLLSARHKLVRTCLDAIAGHTASDEGGLPMTSIDAALAAAVRKCVEPSPTALDPKTLLGKVAAGEIKGVSAIERRCGTPGALTVDGKLIGSSASNDFLSAAIEAHVATASCRVETFVGLTYNGAAVDLSAFTARPSQGGAPLDQSFPCMGP